MSKELIRLVDCGMRFDGETNMMNRKERKNTNFGSEKTKKSNRASGLYIVRKCAENIPQKVKWDTPNGKMGHSKWRNGIPQMAKWDTPNGEMGHPK